MMLEKKPLWHTAPLSHILWVGDWSNVRPVVLSACSWLAQGKGFRFVYISAL
jgi:hypothetical protein